MHRTQHEDVPEHDPAELARVAVELHDRDRERQETEAALSGALEEMEVPPEYLRKAKEELDRRSAEKSRRRKQVLKVLALSAGFVTGFVLLSTFLNGGRLPLTAPPPSPPLTYDFSGDVRSQWTSDFNGGTQGQLDFPKEANGNGFASLRVDRFQTASGTQFQGRHWANLETVDGPKDFTTLKSVSFRARGEGLSRVRLRLESGQDGWVSEAFTLTKDWQTYRVRLDGLRHYRLIDGQYRPMGGDQVADKIDQIQFQAGMHVNPVEASGRIDIDDIMAR
jgi:hypothetical protein